MTELAGRVALVTGGSRGIGAATARRLARAGADVAITYVSRPAQAAAVVEELRALGRRALAIEADSGDGDAVVAAVEETVRVLGRIDLLVNNAGIWDAAPIEQLDAERLDRMLAIHVRGSFLASRAAATRMGEGGAIVTIGSSLAERAGGPGMTIYSLTKAALTGMTKGLAWDLGARGVTANVIHPGPTDTDLNPADGPHAEEQRAGLATGRYGSADDVAALVAHLAGPAGRSITGAAFAVDGGVNA